MNSENNNSTDKEIENIKKNYQYLNFIVGSVWWIQYFIPIVIEGNQRGIQSQFFIRKNRKKYANYYRQNFPQLLDKLSKKYQIKIMLMEEVVNYPGLTFLMEGDISGTTEVDIVSSGLFYLKDYHLKVSMTFNADFIWTFEKYIKDVDYVIFPNRIYFETYKKENPYPNKILSLGSSKFDIQFDKNNIYQKYKLSPQHKYCLFFYPKRKWWNNSSILKKNKEKFNLIYQYLKNIGFKIIVKNRHKDTADVKSGDYYFEDTELYPNSSIELLQISTVAIFFSSTTIEECVIYNVPFIDFKVDKSLDRFPFLHHPLYSRLIHNFQYDASSFGSMIFDLINPETEKIRNQAFQEIRNKYLFNPGKISAKLLDYFQEEHLKKVEFGKKIYQQLLENTKKK